MHLLEKCSALVIIQMLFHYFSGEKNQQRKRIAGEPQGQFESCYKNEKCEMDWLVNDE